MIGRLRLNESVRYEIVADDGRAEELTCGDIIQVRAGGQWVTTRIEHSRERSGYYAVTEGLHLAPGLEARNGRDTA